MAIKQTAGRDALGDFAPKFAQLNDDVLFGEVWSREGELSLRDRSVVTVVALMAQGLTDSSFQYHLMSAKNNGVTRAEIAEILTHAAFYAGWPKAWAAFRMAKEVWADDDAADAKAEHQNEMAFPIGAPNDAFAKYFIGQSYLVPLSTEQVGVYNVTFEPGCRNNWHVHHAKNGGGQILICVAGRGFYQEWGKPAQKLHPGDVVNIAPGVKHWHGAAPEMFTLSRCASGSFAVMLQNGSVMMPGVISPTPSSNNSTRRSLCSHTKRSYRPRLSRQAAPCRNVSSRTHGTSCQPQCGHRGISSLRTSNPAMPASMRST